MLGVGDEGAAALWIKIGPDGRIVDVGSSLATEDCLLTPHSASL